MISRPGSTLQLRGSAITSVGQVRSHNEDNVHLWHREGMMLAIVADGMGGAAAGEEASRIAVETITHHLHVEHQTPGFEMPESELRRAVQAANTSIIQETEARPQTRGMGTTLTMAFVHGREARFAHVGDSRAYRVNRDGMIQQITSDHSFVQALLEAGHITEEEAERHPMGNVLYRALGQTEELDVDTHYAVLSVGDKVILCSDGLTRHVRTREIAQIAHQHDNPDQIAHLLVDLANERGGEDNITVVAIVVEENPNVQKRQTDSAFEDEDTIILNTTSRRFNDFRGAQAPTAYRESCDSFAARESVVAYVGGGFGGTEDIRRPLDQ
ncbi:MAG: Stp1/IreP family PP2C-type Ser/Thr phosphatase [Phototrophicaceae bacterium]|jgi:protein phosphatase